MNEIQVKPGDIVVSQFIAYQHWSLVSDKYCELGRPMLISATQRNGTVKEEPWDTVTQGKKTYIADVNLTKPVSEVLKNARSAIGQWKYSVSNKNCEHFVKQVAGLEVSSTQVVAGVTGAVVGVAAVGLACENRNWIKFLGGALLVGSVAVAVTKPKKRPENNTKPKRIRDFANNFKFSVIKSKFFTRD